MTLIDLQEYVKNYNRAIYRLRALGRSAPTEQRLGKFEESIDFKFPENFRHLLLSPLAGLCLEVPEELWARPSSNQELDWTSQYSVTIFSIGFALPDWLDLRVQLNQLPPEETDLIPFMALGAAQERYCFDLDHQIVRWSPNGDREAVHKDLFELILHEFALLEVRWERFKEYHSKLQKAQKRKKRALQVR